MALAGDTVTVVLEGPGGPIETLESVPPGVYVAVVRFSGGAEIRVREVPVHPEATTTLTCSGRFANCTVSGP